MKHIVIFSSFKVFKKAACSTRGLLVNVEYEVAGLQMVASYHVLEVWLKVLWFQAVHKMFTDLLIK